MPCSTWRSGPDDFVFCDPDVMIEGVHPVHCLHPCAILVFIAFPHILSLDGYAIDSVKLRNYVLMG